MHMCIHTCFTLVLYIVYHLCAHYFSLEELLDVCNFVSLTSLHRLDISHMHVNKIGAYIYIYESSNLGDSIHSIKY